MDGRLDKNISTLKHCAVITAESAEVRSRTARNNRWGGGLLIDQYNSSIYYKLTLRTSPILHDATLCPTFEFSRSQCQKNPTQNTSWGRFKDQELDHIKTRVSYTVIKFNHCGNRLWNAWPSYWKKKCLIDPLGNKWQTSDFVQHFSLTVGDECTSDGRRFHLHGVWIFEWNPG